ncbi:MAG: hypothetical protein GXO22_01150 [Aquificae bacterium]|nr:hypothetical protein [Aquificota bacterium]
MDKLTKLNKSITKKELQEYLTKNSYLYGEITTNIYLEILENFEDDELIPDKILMNLGINPQTQIRRKQ